MKSLVTKDEWVWTQDFHLRTSGEDLGTALVFVFYI